MIKPSELHQMKDAEISEELDRLRRRVFELRTQRVTEKLENPYQISQARRDVARLLTEQRARELKTNPKPGLRGSRAERKAQRAQQAQAAQGAQPLAEQTASSTA